MASAKLIQNVLIIGHVLTISVKTLVLFPMILVAKMQSVILFDTDLFVSALLNGLAILTFSATNVSLYYFFILQWLPFCFLKIQMTAK